MNFLGRELVCERLRLNVRQSYRIVGSSRSGLIASDEIVRLLNRSRRGMGMDAPLSEIPSDIATPDELCEKIGIKPSKLRAWSRRTKYVCPHFRLNGHTRRYSVSRFVEWLSRNSRMENYS